MPVSPADYKAALGRFASGVTVVSIPSDAGIHGITVSAFLSLSLDPPLVLVSIAKSAKAHAILSAAPHFGVSILAADQQAQSNHFAGYGPGEPTWEQLGGVQVLRGSLAALACTVQASHDAGDHTLFIGRVDATYLGEGEPLLYSRGKYRSFVPLS